MSHHLLKTFLRPAFVLLIALISGCAEAQEPMVAPSEKINGISFVGGRTEVDRPHIEKLVDLHANYVSLMPYSYGKTNDPKLVYTNIEWQWLGETEDGVIGCAQRANEQGLEVMIKPHIWFDSGSYTGDFGLSAEEDWLEFENSYYDYIMQFAVISEQLNAPLFCIGTELTRFVAERPQFWFNLIKDVRQVYSGKLTYAANWDSFTRIPFWNELDMIGIDAYFPLCKDQTPSIKAVVRGWYPHLREMKSFAEAHKKPILFTEWGFRSADYCAKEPWDYDIKLGANMDAQSNSLEATFQEFWGQPWFAGGFLWKWFPTHKSVGGLDDSQFTPQNKPAEAVIQKNFKQWKL
jgi:hypothetical protein